jgi:hypothetical protein
MFVVCLQLFLETLLQMPDFVVDDVEYFAWPDVIDSARKCITPK